MNKYRIVKLEKINGKGEVEESFYAQKKFLWFWLDYKFTVYYFTITGPLKVPSHGITITKIKYFGNIKNIEKYIKITEYNFRENYKGNKIGFIINREKDSIIYVNWSCSRKHGDFVFYEYSDSLQSLKDLIDRRIVNYKKTIITK